VARIAYEDLTAGRVFDLGSTSVEKDEMLAFNTRYDPQPFHVDADAAARSWAGGLCASGWFTASLWMRCYVDTVLSDSTSMGSPGGREMLWPAPVYPGDVLDMRMEILAARVSRSRPKLGLVDLTGTAWRGAEQVLGLTFTGMFGRREG
jgi:acyl dehydratase